MHFSAWKIYELGAVKGLIVSEEALAGTKILEGVFCLFVCLFVVVFCLFLFVCSCCFFVVVFLGGGRERGRLCLTQHYHHPNDSCIKMGSCQLGPLMLTVHSWCIATVLFKSRWRGPENVNNNPTEEASRAPSTGMERGGGVCGGGGGGRKERGGEAARRD